LNKFMALRTKQRQNLKWPAAGGRGAPERSKKKKKSVHFCIRHDELWEMFKKQK